MHAVAVNESGGGNVFPPPPVTHSPMAGAIITVQTSGGQEIARSIADDKGGFRIELSPGTYVVGGIIPPGRMFILAPDPQTIVVADHFLTQVVVTYKTISHF